MANNINGNGENIEEFFDLSQSLGENSAEIIAQSFKKASREIANSLAEAARSGELSFKKLAASIMRDLSNLAVQKYVTAPLEKLLGQVFESLPQYGARASGGAINRGGAYLVGENGPEYFIPNSAGNIENALNAPINININMPQGARLDDVKRSANQVSTALARAVERGWGRL